MPASLNKATILHIQSTEALARANITSVGSGIVGRRGFVFSETSRSDPGNTSPAASDYEYVADEYGDFDVGQFELLITGISQNTTYYVRAFGQNTAGYAYGDEQDFLTLEGNVVGLSSQMNIATDLRARLVRTTSLRSIHNIRFDLFNKGEYAIRYTGSFTGADQLEHEVDILDRDYSGESIRLLLALEGWFEEIGDRDKHPLEPISVSKGKLYIFDYLGAIRETLYTIDQEKFRIVHRIGGEVVWVGKVLTEQYQKPLEDTRNIVEILATDGLGDLQDVIYGDRFTTSEVRGGATRTIKDTVVRILSSLGYEIEIEMTFDWHVYGLSEERLLEHVYVNDSMLTARSAYEILRGCMIALASRLYMENGKWIVEQLELKDEPYLVHRYNYNGLLLESYEYDPIIDAKFGEDHEYKYRVRPGFEMFDSGYNKAIVKSVIPRSDSSRRSVAIPLGAARRDFPFGYYGKIKDFNFQYWIDENTPAFWNLSAGANVQRVADTEHGDAYSLQINNTSASNEYIEAELVVIKRGTSARLNLRLYAKRVGSGVTLFGIIIKCGDQYVHYDDGAEEYYFDPAYNRGEIPITSSSWQEFELEVALPDEGGELLIRLFGGRIIGGGSYSGVRFDYIRPLIIEEPVSIEYEANDTEAPYERTLEIESTMLSDEQFPYQVPRITPRHWKREPYVVDELPSGRSIMDLVAETHLAMRNKRILVREEQYVQRGGITRIAFRDTLQIDDYLFNAVYLRKLFRRGLIAGQWVQIKDLSEEIYPPFDPNNPCDDYDTYGDGVPPAWERWGVFWYMGHIKRFRESDGQHFLRNEPVISALYSVLHGWRFIGDELGGGHNGIFPANYHITAELEIQTFNLPSAGHGIPRRFGIFAQYQGAKPAHPNIPGVYCGIYKNGLINYNPASPAYLQWGAVLELGSWQSTPFFLSELSGVLRMEIYKNDEALMCELYNEAGLIKALAIPVPDPNDVDDPAWRYWNYSSQPDHTGNIGCYSLGTGNPSQHINLYSICVYDETTFSPPPLPDFDGDLNIMLLSEIDAQEHEHEKIFITLQSEVFDDGTP
jgi:hypothetical protein